ASEGWRPKLWRVRLRANSATISQPLRDANLQSRRRCGFLLPAAMRTDHLLRQARWGKGLMEAVTLAAGIQNSQRRSNASTLTVGQEHGCGAHAPHRSTKTVGRGGKRAVVGERRFFDRRQPPAAALAIIKQPATIKLPRIGPVDRLPTFIALRP